MIKKIGELLEIDERWFSCFILWKKLMWRASNERKLKGRSEEKEVAQVCLWSKVEGTGMGLKAKYNWP